MKVRVIERIRRKVLIRLSYSWIIDCPAEFLNEVGVKRWVIPIVNIKHIIAILVLYDDIVFPDLLRQLIGKALHSGFILFELAFQVCHTLYGSPRYNLTVRG